MDKRRWLTSCLGLGFGPVAPGTWGSLPPVVLYLFLAWLGTGTMATTIAMAVLVIVGSVVCVVWSPVAIAACGKKDPGEVVADELAGQAIALLAVPPLTDPRHILIVAATAFMAFRVLDIVKLWPCRRLERLPAGWGILLDDLAAGVYAAIVVQLVSRLVLAGGGA
jgi:phosphatidylglycerophosphatase A